MEYAWNSTLEIHFCEGIQIPYLVPGVFEFFSMLSSIPIMLFGMLGFFQKVDSLALNMCYASMFMSGLGSVLLHSRRIAAFNLADTFPILVTFVITICIFMEEMISKCTRRRSSCRGMTEFLIYTAAMGYLIIGLILQAYPPTPSIFGYYFGVPLALGTVFCTLYVFFFCRKIIDPNGLKRLSMRTLLICLSVIPMKLIDAFWCNSSTVWLFPHSLFHILQVYGSWCVIVLITVFKATYSVNPAHLRDMEITWIFCSMIPVMNETGTALSFNPRSRITEEVDGVNEGDGYEIEIDDFDI